MTSNPFENADRLPADYYTRNAGGIAYGQRRIPDPVDDDMTERLRAWLAMDEAGRASVPANLKREESDMLRAYSDRMATLAVRAKDPEFCYLGLLAAGVDDWRFDYRENLMTITLHYDALRRLGLGPEEWFEKAAKMVPPAAAKGLRLFLTRSPGMKTPESMGSIAGSDADGFRYLYKRW